MSTPRLLSNRYELGETLGYGGMLLGLAWLVVNYIAGEKIPVMMDLGSWNFGIGFSLIIVGLLMTMRWR